MPVRSPFTPGLSSMYLVTWVRTSSRGRPSRLVKNQFTSGWVNRYADVDAETPDDTPARSAAEQFGGFRAGSSAMADGSAPNNIAPAIAPAPIAPANARRPARAESDMVKLLLPMCEVIPGPAVFVGVDDPGGGSTTKS